MANHPKLTVASYQGDIQIDMHSIQNGLRYYTVPYHLIYANPPSQGQLNLHFPTWMIGLKEKGICFEGQTVHTGEPLFIWVWPISTSCSPTSLLRLALFGLSNFESSQVSNGAVRLMLYHTNPDLQNVSKVQIYAVTIGTACEEYVINMLMYTDEELEEQLRGIKATLANPAATKLLQLILEYYQKCSAEMFDNLARWETEGVAFQNQLLSLYTLAHPMSPRSMFTESSLRIALTIALQNPIKHEALNVVDKLSPNHVAKTQCTQIRKMVKFMTYLPAPPAALLAQDIPPPPVIGRWLPCSIL